MNQHFKDFLCAISIFIIFGLILILTSEDSDKTPLFIAAIEKLFSAF